MEIIIYILASVFFASMVKFLLQYRKMLIDPESELYMFYSKKPAFFTFMRLFSPVVILGFIMSFLACMSMLVLSLRQLIIS